MFSVRHLQQRREELQQQYDLLSEKINRLRIDSAIQAGTLVAFQLDKEIERFEAERDRLQRQIDSLKSERIQNALLHLNYVQQVHMFREFMEEQRIGAFLVHGSSQHGQIWLLKRLLRAVPDSTVTPLIEFYLYRKIFRNDVTALWKKLGHDIGATNGSSFKEIERLVVNQLKSQNLILVIHEIDCMDETYLNELIRDFWFPLADAAHKVTYFGSEFFLLMFLVDHSGCVSQWNISFADQIDPRWEPCIPIRLPIIDCLSERVLASWIENAIDYLPPKVTKKIDYTVKVILENSENGIPELVFAEIFKMCDCDWHKGENSCLNL